MSIYIYQKVDLYSFLHEWNEWKNWLAIQINISSYHSSLECRLCYKCYLYVVIYLGYTDVEKTRYLSRVYILDTLTYSKVCNME